MLADSISTEAGACMQGGCHTLGQDVRLQDPQGCARAGALKAERAVYGIGLTCCVSVCMALDISSDTGWTKCLVGSFAIAIAMSLTPARSRAGCRGVWCI